MKVTDEMVGAARAAWLASASDYARLDESIRAAIEAALAKAQAALAEAEEMTRMLVGTEKGAPILSLAAYHAAVKAQAAVPVAWMTEMDWHLMRDFGQESFVLKSRSVDAYTVALYAAPPTPSDGLLRRVRSSLQTELERGVITDTLWMNDNPSETIFDALDAALAEHEKAK